MADEDVSDEGGGGWEGDAWSVSCSLLSSTRSAAGELCST